MYFTNFKIYQNVLSIVMQQGISHHGIGGQTKTYVFCILRDNEECDSVGLSSKQSSPFFFFFLYSRAQIKIRKVSTQPCMIQLMKAKSGQKVTDFKVPQSRFNLNLFVKYVIAS